MGICVKDKCTALTVGGNMVAPNEFCRPHLLREVDAELVECDVLLGRVSGLDGVSVGRGGVVKLHPGETRIEQLESAGVVRRRPPEKTPKPTGSGSS
ncbi:hypothetical protein [Actinomadura alba]|uniref:Uncharacterized protein n=1 Tax=Actinomadura alba TaxID=406431 RepID=A0ABR7LHD6_9ACTN|nr:hypothetical protein [Actinomadura alba]MBC6464257.1 hypothetical protein [Actinomadura alba]